MSKTTDMYLAPIDDQINDLQEQMFGLDGDSEKYTAMLKNLDSLYRMRLSFMEFELELYREDKPKRLDPNTLISAGVNLLGILLILNHEKENVLTTKSLSFINKNRV